MAHTSDVRTDQSCVYMHSVNELCSKCNFDVSSVSPVLCQFTWDKENEITEENVSSSTLGGDLRLVHGLLRPSS